MTISGQALYSGNMLSSKDLHTVKPRSTDTHLIRSPEYNHQPGLIHVYIFPKINPLLKYGQMTFSCVPIHKLQHIVNPTVYLSTVYD